MAKIARDRFLLLLYAVLFSTTAAVIYLAVNRSRTKQLNKLELVSQLESELLPEKLASPKKTPGQELTEKIQLEVDLRDDVFYEKFLRHDLNKLQSMGEIDAIQNLNGKVLQQESSSESDNEDEYLSFDEESSSEALSFKSIPLKD